MRHVVDTNEVPHLWAHQTQSDARNKQGNLYFEGDTIYSYGSHFPIARHVKNKKGVAAVLLTTRTYGQTTAGHIGAVRVSIAGGTVFHVSTVCDRYGYDAHEENWRAYISEMEDTASKAQKARKYRDGYLADFARLVTEANAYAAFFGLGKKYRIDASKEAAALVAEFNENREKIEKAAKAKAAKEAKNWERELSERIEQWKAGAAVYLSGLNRVFLRIETVGDTLAGPGGRVIVTSRGARFPLDHGIRAFKLIAAVKSRGETWERNGHTIHLGHYAIDRIDADGTVKAGCHLVEWSEIERIARAVGVLA